jgi:arginine repressor
MTGQTWVRSSLRNLRDRLEAVGHPVSASTVGRLLKELDYALRVNAKKREA